MNKAFVKDDDTWEDPEIRKDPRADIPSGSRNYMTPAGARQLRQRLDLLVGLRRPRIENKLNLENLRGPEENISLIRELRKTLRRIESDIEYLTVRLSLTETVDPLSQNCEFVCFGATVTVAPSDGIEKTYQIVGLDETDIEKGRISWTSPLARAMLNAMVGDLVKVTTPGGNEEMEIVGLDYREIE